MKSEVKMSGTRPRINRVFEAPRAMVFAYWTQVEKLQQWAGCKDATKVAIQAESTAGRLVHAEDANSGARGVHVFGDVRGNHRPPAYRLHRDHGTGGDPRNDRVFRREGTKVVVTQEGFPDPKLGHIVSQAERIVREGGELLAVVQKN
jgi:hypothetical protein